MDDNQGAIIGNSSVSKTITPKCYRNDKTGVIYFDCPGFNDNKGPEQDIANSIFIQQLFSITEKVKIALVATIFKFEHVNSRGSEILRFIE